MAKTNEQNERIKRKYYSFMKEAKGRNDKTVNKIALALSKYEDCTKFKCFKRFHVEDAGRYKQALRASKNARTKKPLAHATVDAELRLVKNFFLWLAGQSGYKSRISYADCEYFNNTLKDARIAHTHRPMPYPTLKQCQRAFEVMPDHTPDQKRDKAAFAFFVLVGARLKAASTLRLKHINWDESCVFQDAREVKTKGAKTITTYFYPVDKAYKDTLRRWVDYLYEVELFGPEDPLFPKPKIGVVKGKGFTNLGLSREPYASTSKLYSGIKNTFMQVQMPAYTPHNFRRTHGAIMHEFCEGDPSKMRAWSMSYGHDDLITTINSYVPVGPERQRDIMQEMQRRAGHT